MSRIMVAILATGMFAPTAAADGFGQWKMNKEKQRAECTYSYVNKSGGTSYNTVLRYPANDAKAGWDYFANAKGDVWAKCMNKRNPNYKPGVMQWCLCEPDGKVKQTLRAGDCPTPKDGAMPITEEVPDPKF
jgi:hypothetical protein